jgi:hypothetical protein
VLELAVYLSIKQGDEAAFERNYSQLRVYYSDARGLLAPSGQEAALSGLNLLRLLVQNRIAEFHTELEVVPPEVLQRPEVAQVRGLAGGWLGWSWGLGSACLLTTADGCSLCWCCLARLPRPCIATHTPAPTSTGPPTSACPLCGVPQVVELEQWLMEGAYNKVLDARARAPTDYHRHFLDQLSSTVRCGAMGGWVDEWRWVAGG